MLQFCKENIQSINYIHITSNAAVDNARVILNEILEGVTRIPGTK